MRSCGSPGINMRQVPNRVWGSTSSRVLFARSTTLVTFAAMLAACGQALPAESVDTAPVNRSPSIATADHHDVSPPLTLIPPAARSGRLVEHPVKMLPRPYQPPAAGRDPVQQSRAVTLNVPTIGVNFDGIGNGVAGFSVASAPPDTNGSVGPNHYVQSVNSDFAVYNKTGGLLYGPVALNTLWSGFGGLCQTDNDGDPVVLYDRAADRWVISQFAVTGADGAATPYLECVAVSKTPDPTGAYNRYSFSYNGFDDYPKMSVWPDGYYTTFNMFNAAGTAFLGGKVCAYDRTRMIAGTAATQQCFDLGTSFGGVLTADLDGTTAPPAGAPNYVLALGANANELAFWKFHTDWTTPANSTLTGPTVLATAAYTSMCPTVSRGVCIPQSGTTQQLESLSDRLMFRLAYRNFGDHEALVANHTVQAGSGSGVRWYELRNPATTPTIFQQGTYAPDANFRWVASVAMDKAGGIALGTSVSGTGLHPQIHFTGRLAGDAAGTMTQGEGSLIDGAGSQTGSNLARWGDYSSLSIDPVDDCTFWYTTEYIPSNGAFNWKTRIGSFKLAGCGGVPPANDFSISANPSSLSLNQNATGTSTIATTVVTGSGTVSLAVSGTPSGATATLSPTSVAAGSSSTLTVNTGTAAPGSYVLTVTGTEGTVTHSATVSLTVNPPAGSGGITNGGFETGTLSGWTTAGSTSVISTGAHSGTYAARAGATTPTANDSSIAQTFTVPAGASSLSFWYNVHCPDTITYDWATATLKDNAAGTTATVLAKVCSNTNTWTQVTTPVTAGKSYTLTLISHDDNYAGDATYTDFDDVTLPVSTPTNDFSISASPSSLTLGQNVSGTSSISTALVSGTAGTVNLTASVSPAGPTLSLAPTSVTVGSGSTLTVSTGTSTPGTYTVTVTGTEGSISHTATVTLTVTGVNDFSISASPTSLSIAQGGSGNSTISTAIVAGSAGTVSLTASGAPAGSTATLSPTSVTAGGSSTLAVSVGASTATGSYTITVTGTEGSKTHSTTVALTVTAPVAGGITNGGFETGTFSGWTITGTATIVSTGCHTGSYCAQAGSTVPTNGDSSVVQTFTAPTGKTRVSLWYASTCPDTVTYDWVTVTLKDNTTATTTTVVAKVCDASGTWKNVTSAVTAGHSYTLTLTNHDDNYTGDATYTKFDDVTLN